MLNFHVQIYLPQHDTARQFDLMGPLQRDTLFLQQATTLFGVLLPGMFTLASEATLPLAKQPTEASHGRAQSSFVEIHHRTAMINSYGRVAESLEVMTTSI